MAKKRCSKCGRNLEVSKNFHKSSSSISGYGYQCKDCSKSYRVKKADIKTVLHTNVDWDLVMAAKIPSRT